jgi:hypothetical protein
VTSWKGTGTSRGSQDSRINIDRQLFGASEANRTVRSCEELFDGGYFAFEIIDPEGMRDAWR